MCVSRMSVQGCSGGDVSVAAGARMGGEAPCDPWVGSGPADSRAASVGVRRGHTGQ